MSAHSTREGPPNRRGRVLVVAYACSPYLGSEPGIGWHRVSQIARRFETWVISKKQGNQAHVHRYVAEHGPLPGLRFHFLPLTRAELALRALPGFYYLTYNLWQRRAYALARRLHRRRRFDLVHHVTLAGFREPGYMWGLGPPFVWGPVGGTQNYPWRFLSCAGPAGAAREAARNVLNVVQLRLSPRVRAAARNAAALLTANSMGQRDLWRAHGVRPLLLADVGAREPRPRPAPPLAHGGPLRVLWSGVFEHRKALHLLIGALARLSPEVRWEARILGDGPLRARWRRLARRAGVDAHLHWLGWLPLQEAHAQYHWADVFAFTSLRDTMATVVPEALSHGLPILCLDHQGVGDAVTGRCGVKIPVTTPAEVVSTLADRIAAMARGDIDLKALSRGALARSRRYLWSAQGRRLAELYERVLDAEGQRP